MAAMEALKFNPRFPTPSLEVQRMIFVSFQEAEEKGSRDMRCPVCGFKVTDVLDLRQYLRHKKLNIFSPCLNIGNYVYYAARASSSTCCGVL